MNDKPETGLSKPDDATLAVDDENLPPVVLRMVVEIRSDGSQTIARGAIEDRITGQRAELKAAANSPAALATELSRALLGTSSLGKLLSGPKDAVGRAKKLLHKALTKKP